MKLCSVENCSRKFYGNNLCHTHYMRVRRKGNVQSDKPIYESFESIVERFKDKICYEPVINGCFNWKGATNRYGKFTVGSRLNGTKTAKSAHRVAYELFIGKIPKGMFVLHKCDNTKCVNIEHLFLGTQMDNMKDMISKGRDNKRIAR
jgi:HNH endonuclease